MERSQTTAQAQLYLGFMHLDGDGASQSDDAAARHFEDAWRTADEGLRAMERRRACCVGLLPHDEAHGHQVVWDVLRDVQTEAGDALESIERFTFFANGRP